MVGTNQLIFYLLWDESDEPSFMPCDNYIWDRLTFGFKNKLDSFHSQMKVCNFTPPYFWEYFAEEGTGFIKMNQIIYGQKI